MRRPTLALALLLALLAAPVVGQPQPTPRDRQRMDAELAALPPCPDLRRENGLVVEAVPLGGYACAREQTRFLEAIRRYSAATRDAGNPIRLNELRRQRGTEFCSIVPSGRVRDWRGTLQEIERLPSGAVAISVSLLSSGPPALRASFAESSQMARRTQLSPGTPQYEALRDMRRGERVSFDGEFVMGGDDCMQGARQTDMQMMVGAEFFFRFTDIRRR